MAVNPLQGTFITVRCCADAKLALGEMCIVCRGFYSATVRGQDIEVVRRLKAEEHIIPGVGAYLAIPNSYKVVCKDCGMALSKWGFRRHKSHYSKLLMKCRKNREMK